MTRFLAGRVLSMMISLFLIITITFILLHLIPGGPFSGEKALPEAVTEALEEKYHLNDSFWKQYTDYLKDVVKLKLGPSFQKKGYTVNELIGAGFSASAKVGSMAIMVSLLMGILLGIISALKYKRWQDQLTMLVATLGVTIPSFVSGTLIIYFFGVKLNWIPTFGLNGWTSYIGPVITLAFFSMAFISRLMRSSMLEVLRQDYIRTARAKGLSEFKVMSKHVLKNALIPVIAYVGPMSAAVLTGAFVTEKIFSIPGMGEMFVESVGNRDYTVVMGATILYAVILNIMNLMVDIVYSILDPRIRLYK